VRRPLIGLLYQPRMIDVVERGAVGGMRIIRGNRNTRRKIAPISITNRTRHGPGSNPGRRGEKLEANRLSYGTANLWLMGASNCVIPVFV
jgi:hypothetical protein